MEKNIKGRGEVNIKAVGKNIKWGKGTQFWERKSRFKKMGGRISSLRELYTLLDRRDYETVIVLGSNYETDIF